MVPQPFPFQPEQTSTHKVRVLPLHRALALLLVEQRNLLGLQPCDGLRPVVLGVEVDLPHLEEGIQVIILAGEGVPITFSPPFYRPPSRQSMWLCYGEASGVPPVSELATSCS